MFKFLLASTTIHLLAVADIKSTQRDAQRIEGARRDLALVYHVRRI
jgi:hypothetical protein